MSSAIFCNSVVKLYLCKSIQISMVLNRILIWLLKKNKVWRIFQHVSVTLLDLILGFGGNLQMADKVPFESVCEGETVEACPWSKMCDLCSNTTCWASWNRENTEMRTCSNISFNPIHVLKCYLSPFWKYWNGLQFLLKKCWPYCSNTFAPFPRYEISHEHFH